ncbi:Fes1-domain-containing protein [Amniculicola lignicola CBS 123094]|uniref:Fes1-domain-containing protein n=1 Tax=Amniculicola lignicola CBS 123094 TaxID=1392246 RepID=A0A6A5WND8_9PLEO|nr:Fes1-domain-containing protein [Amniculicola lignicola CBS 123094]
MTEPNFNNLLKWSIENSEASRTDPDAPKKAPTRIDPAVFKALMGGPSDADYMRMKMDVITSDDATLEQKVRAFDDFEMLIETIDNANNIAALKLWDKLVAQLDHEEADIRKYAAWCAGTAVENNPKAQEKLMDHNAIPTLARLATEDTDRDVRKKAIRALSQVARNFQPGLDLVVEHIHPKFKPEGKLDAEDMASVDSLILMLRETL